MYLGQIIKKVPGEITKGNKTEHLEDLTSLSKIALLENLQRQEKILANTKFLAKLPDKGRRVLELKNRLDNELKKRENEDISSVMAGLSLKEDRISDELEWRLRPRPEDGALEEGDGGSSDGEEGDPLKILVSHSSATNNQKIYRVETLKGPLITPGDSDHHKTIIEDVYAANLCKKFDAAKEQKQKFLPYKTLRNNCNEKKLIEISQKLRDISAATPPPPVHGDVKLVSLEQSIQLQIEQAKQLREVQLKHAVERLKERNCLIGDTLPPKESIKEYREPQSYSEEDIFHDCEENFEDDEQ